MVLEKQINYLSEELTFKLEIKASYLLWNMGIESDNGDSEITDFYNFCNDFFAVWEKYFKRILPLLSEFNIKEDLKPVYAEILSRQYGQYLRSLKELSVPESVSPSFSLFIDSVQDRQNYFNLYTELPQNNADNISDEAEYSFWLKLFKKNMEMGHFSKEVC